jgi:retron-type reverse transcriptase
MAAKLVLEPIFEANFLESSYGFRPCRGAHLAMRAIRSAVTFERQTVVIDLDVRSFFDNLRQEILMDLVQRRVSDPRC